MGDTCRIGSKKKHENVKASTREELKLAENWNTVYELKQLKVVVLKFKCCSANYLHLYSSH